jgi:PAS domain S-box-containing protein
MNHKSAHNSSSLNQKGVLLQDAGKSMSIPTALSSLIIDNSHIGIFIINDAFECIYANNEMANIVGYTIHEIIGSDFRKYLPKEGRDSITDLYVRRQKGHSLPNRYEAEFIRKDGERRAAEINVFAMKTIDRQIVTAVQTFDITDRKRMKEEIEKSEKKYRLLVETIQDYVSEHDLSGNFTFVNEALVKLAGYTRDELLGMNYHKYILPEDIGQVEAFYKTIYNTGKPGTGLQYRARSKDGTIRQYEAKSIMITDDQNQPIGWRSIAQDITEKKQIEENLRKSEKKYHDFFENVLDFIFIHDLDGNFIENNARYVTEVGGQPDVIAASNLRDLMPEKFKPEFDSYIKRILHNGRDEGIIAIQVPVGEVRILEYKNILQYDDDNHPVSVMGSARDITDHIKDKKALRESKERYEMIVENVEDYIFEQDLAGNFTYVNETPVKNMGYSKEELIGMNYRQYTLPEEKELIETYHYNIFKTGKSGKGLQHRVVRKDGSLFDVELVSTLMKNSDGDPIGYRGISRDITERRLAEKILKKSERQLKEIIEGSPIPTIVFNKEHHITHWNRACEELTGIKSADVVGKHKKIAETFMNQPILPDFLIKGGSLKEISSFFGSECRKSKIVKNAFEVESFFPQLGEKGKWLFLTLAFLRDSEKNSIGMIETMLDITSQKYAEKNLLKMHNALEEKVEERTQELQKVNIALEVLLKKRENDKKKFEDKVAYSIKEILTPHLELLKKTHLDKHQKVYLEILEANFQEIASPFMAMLSDNMQKLTRTEIQIINLIKQNKITKEIADLMGISTRTVETHRDNIRKKLGIKNKKTNLRSYLLASV